MSTKTSSHATIAPPTARDPIKVYDARWEIDDFSEGEVERLFEATLAYGRELGVDTVTFTRDARLGCAAVLEIGMQTALRAGFRVIACTDPISTPQGYFVALRTSARHPKTMGLVVTASHNPAQYIGVKFTVPTVQAIGLGCGPMDGLTKVREIYHSDEKFRPTPGGELHLANHPTKEFVEFSLEAAGVKPGDLAGLTVVVDAFHGSAGPEIWHALRTAGVEVVPLRIVPNGQFPTGSPSPTSQGKMHRAILVARQEKADVVLGIDGDGDRIVFGDRRGILSAGFVTLPIIRALLAGGSLKPGAKVLYDPKVNPLALAEWGKLGVEPVLFRNGHSQIKDYMMRIGADAGAEESGHYYHRLDYEGLTIAAENSIVTILLFLKAVKASPDLMDHLWKLQKQVFTTGEFNYQFADDATRDKALAAAIDKFESEGAHTQSATPDGIDLEGTVVQHGVTLAAGSADLAKGWYSGYFRIATNEKAVVRSYLSTGDAIFGRKLENRTREMLEKDFGGQVID
jgi:phosphomannomutase